MQSWVRSSLRLGVLGAGFLLFATTPAYAGDNGDGDKVNINTTNTVDNSTTVAPAICDLIDIKLLVIDGKQNTDCYSDDYHKDTRRDTDVVSNDDKNIKKKVDHDDSYGEAGLLGEKNYSKKSNGGDDDGDVLNLTDKDFTDNSTSIAPAICDLIDIKLIVVDSKQNTDCYSDDYHKDKRSDTDVVSNDDKNVTKKVDDDDDSYDEAALERDSKYNHKNDRDGDTVNITDTDVSDSSTSIAPAICDLIDIKLLVINTKQNTDCYSDDYHKSKKSDTNVVSNDDTNIKKKFDGDDSYGEARTEAKPDLSSVLPTKTAPNAVPDASGLTQSVLSKAPTAGNGLMVNDRDLSDTSLVGKLAMPGAMS